MNTYQNKKNNSHKENNSRNETQTKGFIKQTISLWFA